MKTNDTIAHAAMSSPTEEPTPGCTWRALAGSQLTDARVHLAGPSFAASACGTAGSGEPEGGGHRAGQKVLRVAEKDTDQLEL